MKLKIRSPSKILSTKLRNGNSQTVYTNCVSDFFQTLGILNLKETKKVFFLTGLDNIEYISLKFDKTLFTILFVPETNFLNLRIYKNFFL